MDRPADHSLWARLRLAWLEARPEPPPEPPRPAGTLAVAPRASAPVSPLLAAGLR